MVRFNEAKVKTEVKKAVKCYDENIDSHRDYVEAVCNDCSSWSTDELVEILSEFSVRELSIYAEKLSKQAKRVHAMSVILTVIALLIVTSTIAIDYSVIVIALIAAMVIVASSVIVCNTVKIGALRTATELAIIKVSSIDYESIEEYRYVDYDGYNDYYA